MLPGKPEGSCPSAAEYQTDRKTIWKRSLNEPRFFSEKTV